MGSIPAHFLADVNDDIWAIVSSVAMLALAGMAYMAYGRLKKWMSQSDEAASGQGFTLGDLRELHRAGKLSDEEFEKAKAQIIAPARKLAQQLPDPLGRRRPGEVSTPPATSDNPPGPTTGPGPRTG